MRPRAGTCRRRAVTPIESWLTSRPSRKGNRVLGLRYSPEGIVPNRRSRRLASAIQARPPPCSKARSGNFRLQSRPYLLILYGVTNSNPIQRTAASLSIPAESLQTASNRPQSRYGNPGVQNLALRCPVHSHERQNVLEKYHRATPVGRSGRKIVTIAAHSDKKFVLFDIEQPPRRQGPNQESRWPGRSNAPPAIGPAHK
jgi:hypothetical protein